MSFAGLSDLLGGVTTQFAALPAPQREALEVALVRRAGTSRRAPDPRTVAVALRTLLVDLARTRPVVVAVDDVQWLDAATARALAFAARRLDGRVSRSSRRSARRSPPPSRSGSSARWERSG